MAAKKINLNIVGLDGNAFALLAAFRRQAKAEKWTADEIEVVCKEAKRGDYGHLLETLQAHCGPEEDRWPRTIRRGD